MPSGRDCELLDGLHYPATFALGEDPELDAWLDDMLGEELLWMSSRTSTALVDEIEVMTTLKGAHAIRDWKLSANARAALYTDAALF